MISRFSVLSLLLLAVPVLSAERSHPGDVEVNPAHDRPAQLTSSFEPEQQVEKFYRLHTAPLTNMRNDEDSNRFVAKSLLNSIDKSTACNYDLDDVAESAQQSCKDQGACKSSGEQYVCDWDGVWIETDVNYFTKSQDIFPSWENHIAVTLLRKTGRQAMTYAVLGDGSDPILPLVVSLVYEENQWKISRVVIDEASKQQTPSSESGHNVYQVTSNGRLYFHRAPDEKSILKQTFVIPGDRVVVYRQSDGFLYASYFRANGERVDGWLNATGLTKR